MQDMDMIAISVDAPNKLKIREVHKVVPGRAEISVRVRRAGICGSDVHILQGTNPFARYPRIIGHEIAGIVEAIGPGTQALEIGVPVVVDPVVACGVCNACRIGRSNVCAQLEVIGVHRDGGFRSSLVVPAANAVPVSKDLPLDIAALAEPFSIAANVLSLTGCTPEDSVLIYGAGTIGLTILQVAKIYGARCIVADVNEARLETAQAFGADVTIHSTPRAVERTVKKETEGSGPTVVIDAAGDPDLLQEAVSLASPAGRIGLLGFSVDPATVIEKDIVSKEVSIFGSRLNRKLLPKVIEWLESGALRPAGMISNTFPAVDAKAAFETVRLDPSPAIKVQLEF